MEKYGINLDRELTPLIVRDVLVNCFFEAHCADAGFIGEEKATNKSYCGELIKKAFDETGGNFDNPTKGDIAKVLNKLVDFSKSFRKPEVIEKHFNEMKDLVDKLA
jgi:hypothetical protein